MLSNGFCLCTKFVRPKRQVEIPNLSGGSNRKVLLFGSSIIELLFGGKIFFSKFPIPVVGPLRQFPQLDNGAVERQYTGCFHVSQLYFRNGGANCRCGYVVCKRIRMRNSNFEQFKIRLAFRSTC